MLLKRESKCWSSVVTQLASTSDFVKRIQTDGGVTGWCHLYRSRTFILPRWPSRWNRALSLSSFHWAVARISISTDSRDGTIHRSGNRVDHERPCSAGAAREIVLSVDSVRIDAKKNGVIARYALESRDSCHVTVSAARDCNWCLTFSSYCDNFNLGLAIVEPFTKLLCRSHVRPVCAPLGMALFSCKGPLLSGSELDQCHC